MSQDPIGYVGKIFNRYLYIDNNPVNGTDPLGLCQKKGKEPECFAQMKTRAIVKNKWANGKPSKSMACLQLGQDLIFARPAGVAALITAWNAERAVHLPRVGIAGPKQKSPSSLLALTGELRERRISVRAEWTEVGSYVCMRLQDLRGKGVFA